MATKKLISGVLLTVCVAGAAWAQSAFAASEVADAVMHRDDAALHDLLAHHADVNAAQADGATALHWAAYLDDVKAAQALIKAGAKVNVANVEGMTPLFLACQSGDAAMVKLLLDSGADATHTLSHGETPLMMAARTGKPEVLDLLLQHGANVNAKESLRGTTALMWAAAYSNPEAVKFLVEHGADVSAHSATIKPGRGPYLAPSARTRIEQGARGVGQGGTIGRAGKAAGAKAAPGGAAAAANDDSQEVADDNDETAGGVAASSTSNDFGDADAIARKDKLEKQYAAAIADIKYAPPTERQLRAKNNKEQWGGLTPLVFAARQNDLASAKILIEHGADVNETTEYGWTPLLTATQNRSYQLGKFFLEHGANPNIANGGGWTPLYIATDNRNIEGGDYPVRKPDMDHLAFIKLLLDHGADPNLRMSSSTETRTVFTNQWLFENGATPFLRAAQSGDLTLMKLLVQHGAKPHIPTVYNVTPLMVASGIGWVVGVTHEWSPEESLETVKYLLSLGADVNAQDILDGRTALMGAADKGRNKVVQALVDAGADLAEHDIGSRDSIHNLAGVTWQAVDYANGLVRVGVQSAVRYPETEALIRKLMLAENLPTPPAGRPLTSVCVTPELCQ